MRWIFAGLLFLGMLGLAPNAYWFWGSSIVLSNQSPAAVTARLALADDPDRLVELGMIAPGASHFQWLRISGEATLEVDVYDGTVWRRHCREYVEQAAYRVEIAIQTPREVTCKVSLAPFQHLLLADYLSGL